ASGLRETEVAVETVPYIVAVKHRRVMTHRVKPLLDDVGDRGLTRPGQPGEPHDRRALALDRGPLRLADQQRLPMKVGSAPQAEVDHPGADRVIGEPVDDDETAGPAVLTVRIEDHRHARREIADADIIQPER